MSDRAICLACVAAAASAFTLVILDAPAWLVAAFAAGGAAEFGMRARRVLRATELHTKAELKRSLRWREEQLANTAHELRTPLTAIATALELVRDGIASTPEDQATFLDQAQAASRHMAFLVNDVVDLAAIEGGRIRLQMREHRVPDLLADVKKIMELPAQTQSVSLAIDDAAEQLSVYADKGRFLQIAFNLVANAVKFSGPGATVRIALAPTRSQVRFEVHDSGPGIDEGRRASLFTRFSEPSASAEAATPGSGLGLYVSSMLVAHMGGAIGFHPAPRRGSVFWFSLPRAERRSSNPTTAKAGQASRLQVEAQDDAHVEAHDHHAQSGAAADANSDEPESVACSAPAPA